MGTFRPFQRIWDNIVDAISQAPIGDEEKLRLKHFFIFVLIGVPALMVYGVYNQLQGSHLLGMTVLLGSACLAVGTNTLLRVKNGQIVYRLCTTVYSGLLLYLVIIGGEDGSKILWLYTFPLIVFFLLGKREGLVWAVLLLLTALTLIGAPQQFLSIYPYSSWFILRFLAIYLIICLITYWFESSRSNYSQQLQDGHKRFLDILEHSRDILYRRDLKSGKYQYVSQAFTSHLGYSRNDAESLFYRGMESLIHPQDRERHRLAVQHILENPHAESFDHVVEYRMRHKNGTYFWFSDQITVICDSSGNPEFLIGGNREITDARRIRLALKRARDQLITILNSIDAHIYVADMKSHHILFMNDKMKQDFGRDLEGKICWREFRNEKGPCAECTNTRLMSAENRPTGLVEWESHNPITSRWYNNYDRAIQWFGGKWVRMQIAIDITRIKEMEAERKRNDAVLRRAGHLEAIGNLAGGMAHDFNNLLQVIQGNLFLASNEDVLPSQHRYHLKAIEKASSKAIELANRLVTFSSGGTPNREPMFISSLLQLAIPEIVEQTGITYTLSLSTDLWSTPIDRNQIGIVIKNLVTNACESIPDKGSLTITAANFTQQEPLTGDAELSEGKYVKITFEDNGCGIPEPAVLKVFDPYYTTKEKGAEKGTGLGLSIVYSIVKQHDGHITMHSKKNTGTTVTVYLPADLPEQEGDGQSGAEQEKEVGIIDTKKILLMDDEAMVRDITKEIFHRLGYEVDAVEDGTQAIKHYTELFNEGKRYLAVILDLSVPQGMGGEQTFVRLLEIDREVRAVVSSGNSSDPLVTNHAAHGFIGALTKPYTMAQARKLVSSL